MEDCDLVIIGGSAAGVAAAIYAARRNLRFKMIVGEFGGEVARSGDIDNYPGFPHTDGIRLTELFRQQLTVNQVVPELGVWVETIIKQPDQRFIITGRTGDERKTYRAKIVIISTGVHPRELNVPGEKALRNRGVSYCTTCDGPLFRGKIVASIGGGNSAMESALMLSALASQVYLININPELKGETVYIEKLKKLANVKLIPSAQTTQILGSQFVSGVEYRDLTSSQLKTLNVQGVFIHIGMVPNSQLVDQLGVKKDRFGSIIVNQVGATNIEGVFAAGDVTDLPYKQVSIAVGQGTSAALAAIDYLNRSQT